MNKYYKSEFQLKRKKQLDKELIALLALINFGIYIILYNLVLNLLNIYE